MQLTDVINSNQSLSATAATIGSMLVNLQSSYGELYRMIKGLCFIFAIVFLVIAISDMANAAKHHGSSGRERESFFGITATFLTAVLFAWLPEVIRSFSQTLLCTAPEASQVFGYTKTASSGTQTSLYLAAAIDFIKFLGTIFFISGVLAMRRVAIGMPYQGENWPSVQWRIIGGIAAINITTTLNIFYNTFGIAPPKMLLEFLQPAAGAFSCG